VKEKILCRNCKKEMNSWHIKVEVNIFCPKGEKVKHFCSPKCLLEKLTKIATNKKYLFEYTPYELEKKYGK